MTDKRPPWSRDSNSPSLHETQGDSGSTTRSGLGGANTAGPSQIRLSIMPPLRGDGYPELSRAGLRSPSIPATRATFPYL